MNDLIKAGLVALVLALSLTAPAAAGPFEDAEAAFRRNDYTTAFRLWRPLAEQGNAPAQYNLGNMYANGEGVPQDFTEAVRWFRKAADQGHATAQNNLGAMNESGRGLHQDAAEAVKWYRKAADQGDAMAQTNLGAMYYYGQGVTQDYAEAVKWYRKAADQGYAGAQFLLGAKYANGQGVSQDYVQAHKWFNLGAAGDTAVERESVKARDAVAARMTPAQIAKARQLAHQWRPVSATPTNVAVAPPPARRARTTSADPEDRSGGGQAPPVFTVPPALRTTTESVEIRKATDQGDARAQNNLGVREENSQGVPLHYFEARRRFRKALDQIEADNQNHLKALLAKDYGVPQDNANRNAPSQEAPRQSPREVQSKVGIPPTITAPPSVQTQDDTVDIAGMVAGGGKVTSLKVDGSEAPFRSDGSFSFRRTVPVGQSDIRLVAANEWGQIDEATIHVVRTIPAMAEATFPALDPSHLKAKSNPKAIALIIGVENYQNAPPAEFAENDARRFYDYAANALGVPRDRIKLLTGADARRLDVQKAIRNWLKPLVVKGQTDVFVFFSGHGLASEDGNDLFLLPYDGDRALLADSAIRRKEMVETIAEAAPASATLFLDTCYSGGTRGKESLVASARPILVAAKEQAVPPNVTILAASGNDQLSSSLESAKHGLFSYFLMKGLEGDAAGSDHIITAAKLEAYLADHIPSEAAKLGRTQSPQLIGDGSRVVSSW